MRCFWEPVAVWWCPQQEAWEVCFAGDANSRSGVRVAVTDLDGDLKFDLLTGGGTASRVTAYLGRDIGPSGVPLAFRDFDAFPGTTGGVFVG